MVPPDRAPISSGWFAPARRRFLSVGAPAGLPVVSSTCGPHAAHAVPSQRRGGAALWRDRQRGRPSSYPLARSSFAAAERAAAALMSAGPSAARPLRVRQQERDSRVTWHAIARLPQGLSTPPPTDDNAPPQPGKIQRPSWLPKYSTSIMATVSQVTPSRFRQSSKGTVALPKGTRGGGGTIAQFCARHFTLSGTALNIARTSAARPRNSQRGEAKA